MVFSTDRCLALLCVFAPAMPHLHTAVVLFVCPSKVKEYVSRVEGVGGVVDHWKVELC